MQVWKDKKSHVASFPSIPDLMASSVKVRRVIQSAVALVVVVAFPG